METRRFSIGVVIGLFVLLTFLLMILAYSRGRYVVSWPDGVEVLTNGGLEVTNHTYQSSASGAIMFLNPGSTAIPGWTITGNHVADENVAWAPNGVQVGTLILNLATEGKFSVDLTGTTDKSSSRGNFCGVQQTFPTVAPNLYELSFDVTLFIPNFPGPITVIASITTTPNEGEAAYAQVMCGPFNPTDPGKQTTTCKGQFRAATASTTVTIVGWGGKSTQYIGLDNVSVQCVT